MRNISLFLFVVVIGISSVAEAQDWDVHEGHAVRGKGTNAPRLVYSDTDAQGLEEFVDLCREACTSGNGDGLQGACGGFVVNYTDRTKTAPGLCVFKLAGSVPYAREGKDTHMLLDAEARFETEEVGGGGTSDADIQALIDNAVTESLEGMVPESEIQKAIDAAVAEATEGTVPEAEAAMERAAAEAIARLAERRCIQEMEGGRRLWRGSLLCETEYGKLRCFENEKVIKMPQGTNWHITNHETGDDAFLGFMPFADDIPEWAIEALKPKMGVSFSNAKRKDGPYTGIVVGAENPFAGRGYLIPNGFAPQSNELGWSRGWR